MSKQLQSLMADPLPGTIHVRRHGTGQRCVLCEWIRENPYRQEYTCLISREGVPSADWTAFRVEDTDMIRLNPYQLYVLGSSIEPLRNLAEGESPDNYFAEALRARGELRKFLDNKELPLATSRPAAEKLVEALSELVTKVFVTMKENAEAKLAGAEMTTAAGLTWGEAHQVTSAIRDFEPVLAAELQEKPTYHVSKKGIFYTPDLIEHADTIFDDALHISEEARADICQAGRCLAFELWTATGFHVFRATETMILRYYEALTGGKKPIQDSQRNWGNYIKLLRDNNADKQIVDYLDYFKTNHRNPVMHPEVTLDKDQAIAVFLATPQAIVPLSKARTALITPQIAAFAEEIVSTAIGTGKVPAK